ncbi:MAG: ROK family protein [Armatimonadota bacterium]
MQYFIGFDIGGTKCAVSLGVLGDDLKILDREAFPTEAGRGPEQAVARMAEAAKALRVRHGFDPTAAGISCGGPLDMERGAIVGAPNLPGWDHYPLVDTLSESLSVPVRIENDANACALAEWKWGAGRGTRQMIFLTFGTGLGAGLILDGKLYGGAGHLAGEVGHVRLADDGPVGHGKRGSFEGFCSGAGIADLAGVPAKEVAEAAKAGDPKALAVFAEVGRRLGQGLAVLIDILNPEMVVIGSIFARCEELIRPEMERVIAAEALALTAGACRVVPAALGEAIGDYASLAVAIG